MRDASLLQNTGKRAKLQLPMVRHYAAGRAASQHDVAAALTRDFEAEPLQSPDCLRAGDDRQLRETLNKSPPNLS